MGDSWGSSVGSESWGIGGTSCCGAVAALVVLMPVVSLGSVSLAWPTAEASVWRFTGVVMAERDVSGSEVGLLTADVSAWTIVGVVMSDGDVPSSVIGLFGVVTGESGTVCSCEAMRSGSVRSPAAATGNVMSGTLTSG